MGSMYIFHSDHLKMNNPVVTFHTSGISTLIPPKINIKKSCTELTLETNQTNSGHSYKIIQDLKM